MISSQPTTLWSGSNDVMTVVPGGGSEAAVLLLVLFFWAGKASTNTGTTSAIISNRDMRPDYQRTTRVGVCRCCLACLGQPDNAAEQSIVLHVLDSNPRLQIGVMTAAESRLQVVVRQRLCVLAVEIG